MDESNKTPNLLNNLLRRIRLTQFPEESLRAVAGKLGVKADYLSKVESGLLEKPNRETFDAMLRLYGCSNELQNCLDMLYGLAEDGTIGSDLGEPAHGTGFAVSLLLGMDVGVRRVLVTEVPKYVLEESRQDELVIFPEAVVAEAFRLVNRGERNDVAVTNEFLGRLKRVLLTEPQRAYLVRLGDDQDAGNTPDSVKIMNLAVLIVARGDNYIASADLEWLKMFDNDFEEYKSKAYPPKQAAAVAKHLIQKVQEMKRALVGMMKKYQEKKPSAGIPIEPSRSPFVTAVPKPEPNPKKKRSDGTFSA